MKRRCFDHLVAPVEVKPLSFREKTHGQDLHNINTTSASGETTLKISAALHRSHQQESDVCEESRSEHQQHQRPREPEAQLPEVKPAEIKHSNTLDGLHQTNPTTKDMFIHIGRFHLNLEELSAMPRSRVYSMKTSEKIPFCGVDFHAHR